MNGHFGLPEELLNLVTALAIGMLVGLERGWRGRGLPQGGRAAGLRTFTLTGLLGGILASLPEDIRVWAITVGFVGIATFMAIAYWRGSAIGNQSITTAIALLLTYALGAYATFGNPLPALGLAVITALLLSLKETLHGWLRKIEQQELRAGFQLLVLSVVILPNLPNRNLGPYDALNPYHLWWAVVLIAALSMAGHIAMRVFGASRGILWTGLLGGLASSTATTLALSRLARRDPPLEKPAIAGTLAATGMMAIRLLVIIWLMGPALLPAFAPALLISAAILCGPLLWQLRLGGIQDTTMAAAPLSREIHPYSLQTALGFGLFLAAVSIFIPAAKTWLGAEGVYAVSALSGVADVDAITISLAQLFSSDALGYETAGMGISIAVLINLLSKLMISVFAGTRHLSAGIGSGYLIAFLAGLSTWFWLP